MRRSEGGKSAGRPSPRSAPQDGELWSAVIDDLNHPGESIDTTLERLAQRAARRLSSSSAIFLVTPSGSLRPAAFWDDDPARLADLAELFAGGRSAGAVGTLGEVLGGGEPVLVPSLAGLQQDDRGAADQDAIYADYPTKTGLDSLLLAPMITGGRTVGILGIGRYNPRNPLDESIIPVASRFAAVAAQVVRVAHLVQRGKVADFALGAMRDAVVALDEFGAITFWNRGAAHLYGVAESEALGKQFTELVHSEVLDQGEVLFDPNRLEGGIPRGQAWMGRLQQRSGASPPRIVESVMSPVQGDGGVTLGTVVVNRDISGMIEIGSALRKKELLAQTALDASPMVMGVFDPDGALLACSRGWRELVGDDRVAGMTIRSFAGEMLASSGEQRRLLDSFHRVLHGTAQEHNDFEVQRDGTGRTLAVWISRVHGVGATLTISDVSDRAQRERELVYSATHDSVTGLPNRGALYSRAVHALNRAARHGNQIGLLFCDLDGFKGLNDEFGHGAGDDLLAAFGARLQESCRASDSVARVGGDEFAILLEDDVTEESLATVAERIVASGGRPFDLRVGTVSVTASVGAALTTIDTARTFGDADVDRLMDMADLAMYDAKGEGKNRWSRFDDAMPQRIRRRSAVDEDIQGAAARGEFSVFYQPQFGRSGELTGAEALLRWTHPQRGVVSAQELLAVLGGIPLAAAEAALADGLGALSRWSGIVPPGFRLTVNLSHEQWSNPMVAQRLLALLDEHRISPTLVRLELDPDSLGSDPDHSAAATRRLAEAGVEMAVNGLDFAQADLLGTRRLSIGCLVLGSRLVRGVRPGNTDFVSGLVALARQMGWRVVATGVETDEQLDAVRAAGCNSVQGLILGAPVPAPQFAATHLPSAPMAQDERP